MKVEQPSVRLSSPCLSNSFAWTGTHRVFHTNRNVSVTRAQSFVQLSMHTPVTKDIICGLVLQQSQNPFGRTKKPSTIYPDVFDTSRHGLMAWIVLLQRESPVDCFRRAVTTTPRLSDCQKLNQKRETLLIPIPHITGRPASTSSSFPEY
jgi:hypothetical protein